jgi:hypothetical protein
LVPVAGDAARVTNGYGEIEFVITPETFHLVFHVLDSRRIFTDGRDFPTDVDPSFLGISIGRWIATKGDGHYVLEVETGNLKGPRVRCQRTTFACGQSDIVKDRYTLDRNNPGVISNEVTVFDHALTLDRDQTLSPHRRPAAVVGRGQLHGRKLSYPHPDGTVVSQRRRNPPAYKEWSATS